MTEPIDYKSLLERYIGHVASIEGTTCMSYSAPDGEFTDDEWAELLRMAAWPDGSVR